jgi:hypothetical protein
MKKRLHAVIMLTFLLSITMTYSARAANFDQNLTLHPGWNAVFLEVEPVSTEPAVVFSSVPNLQSVWRWNPRTSPVEFIQNPDELVPESPQWMVYYPGNLLLSNLHAINGETAYLVHLGGATDVILTVTGQPTVPHIDWKPNSFNFVGFHLGFWAEPFFVNFFSNSLAHAGQEIYVLDNATGSWVQVTSQTYRMKPGEGFWVYCKGSSEFTGPLSVQLEQGSGLHYGTTLVEQNLRVYNNSTDEKDVRMYVSSTTPRYLYYWSFNPANDFAEWVEFPNLTELHVTIPAGEMQKLRLGVRRVGLNAGTPYEDNIFMTDGDSWIKLPLSVTGIDYNGLWVGDAVITKVSEPAATDNDDTPEDERLKPRKTGSEFSFRLILHADDTGTVRLLSQVIQMWQEGTWKPDPNDLGKLIMDEPGHFVLFTDDGLLPNYTGAAMRDGQPVGRRISAPAFPSLNAAQGVMGGSAAPGSGFYPSEGNALFKLLTLAQDNPVNPFRHMFHPDHKTPGQSYQVSRFIALTFSDEDSEGRPITGIPSLSWGSSEIGGIYKETILGLHKQNINIEGTFVLRKVSSIGTLTQ